MGMNTSPVLGKTWNGYSIYAFELLDNEPYAIWIDNLFDDGIAPYHMTQLDDENIVIEGNDQYGEYIYGEYYGDTALMKFHEEYSKNSKGMSQEKANEWLKKLEKYAFATDESVLYDSITEKHYLSNDLPQYIYWSESTGWWAGPGYEEGHLKCAIADPEKELWPLFDLAGIENIKILQDFLKEGKSRKIYADKILIYKEMYGESCFGDKYNYRDRQDLDDQCEAGIDWLNALSGPSLPTLRRAEMETVDQINLWMERNK
ncbi:MAG: hypothetical protein ACRC62_13745 [Microcoleus sp.]